MCGIVGLAGRPDRSLADSLLDRLRHRGPDGRGAWFDEQAGIWLGHTRLRVVDLTDHAAQPMASASGRWIITYNGEVFNHHRLRRRLTDEGARLRSSSDTEVLLEAVDRWGLDGALDATIGMFACALWDRERRELFLVRDRLGIKPLYYAVRNDQLAFASELHALAAVGWVDDELDRAALAGYFHGLAVPGRASVLQGVRKVPPGHVLRWNGAEAKLHRWWSLTDAARRGRADPLPGDLREVADEVEPLLLDAVGLRLAADVPVGSFLSGGVDSSLVTALAQEVSSSPVRTFTIGFDETSHDEAGHARAVAAHVGTDHHEERFTAADMAGLLPEAALVHDEPFADVGSLPYLLLARTARREVTVALSGDGGDELFGGYPRYFWAARIERLRRILGPAAPLAAAALRAVPSPVWDGPGSRLTRSRFSGAEGLSARARRFADYLGTSTERTYAQVLSPWGSAGPPLLEAPDPVAGAELMANGDALTWAEQMMAADQAGYLVDDILTKVDRASMAVSLEARVPLLDHRIVELSWRVPLSCKLAPGGDRGKLLLRELLYRRVPAELIERPKMGFGVPLAGWLRGPLRAWADERLDRATLAADGIIDPVPVMAAWDAHRRGEDRAQQVWTVLAYLEWREAWRKRRAGAVALR